MASMCLAYYCSGHGYGHATRVSAFASHLLTLSDANRPVVLHIVSSAPQHVFVESVACGAQYRFAEIDPIIVQPLAYRVDRGKSVQALQAFLDKKDTLLETEKQWLLDIQANAVLSDAAFLGCQAAKLVGIPSILITNFTFDSVYSYLSTSLRDVQSLDNDDLIPADVSDDCSDNPVPASVLKPLVDQIHFGYRCADLLLRLPGHIPIPSFTDFPSLPSSEWVDTTFNQFLPEIQDHLLQPIEAHSLHPAVFHLNNTNIHRKPVPRSIISAPLFVRPPSSSNVYSPEGRSRLLASIGVPEHLRDPQRTKVLIVSFGGQFIRGPSRPSSRSQSRSTTPSPGIKCRPTSSSPRAKGDPKAVASDSQHTIEQSTVLERVARPGFHEANLRLASSSRQTPPPQIWISAAPPALRVVPTSPPLRTCSRFPSSELESVISPHISYTPGFESFCSDHTDVTTSVEEEPRLLPDSSWIAVICGVSKEQWISQPETEMPIPSNKFFVAPRNVHMPDLTTVGDVLLGKLGYGTVSECVDACTPFVYVSRPLFIEEHGLRLLLEKEGVGVELSRASYESGDWAETIQRAWELGREKKANKRKESLLGVSKSRQDEMGQLARVVLEWIEEVSYSNE